MEIKCSKEYLVIILAVKESLERFSCLASLKKGKHREAGLKHELKLFSDTFLMLVVVNENCCLCICFTELLIVGSCCCAVVILITEPFVFSRSVNIVCRSTQNASHLKHF